MPLTFGFFSDAALSVPVASLTAAQLPDNTLAAVVSKLYFGSANAARKLQALSAPGTAQVAVSVADSNAGGGAQPSSVKLFLSGDGNPPANWGAITAGAAINLGTQINGGSGNAKVIYVRQENAGLLAEGLYTDLSLTTNNVVESALP